MEGANGYQRWWWDTWILEPLNIESIDEQNCTRGSESTNAQLIECLRGISIGCPEVSPITMPLLWLHIWNEHWRVFQASKGIKITAEKSVSSLSAIMLGRLRMDVNDCLRLYRELGERIFSRPRRMHIRGHPIDGRWWWPRSKYNSTDLGDLFREQINEIIRRQSVRPPDDAPLFQSREDQCRTWEFNAVYESISWLRASAVIAVNETRADFQPHLFRTYDHFRDTTRPWNIFLRNPGAACDTEIWQVARATTAAPGFFSPMRIDSKIIYLYGFRAQLIHNSSCSQYVYRWRYGTQ